MSSRWYPRYVRGNPQLRVFLPDFPMVLVPTKYETPKNVVHFKTPIRMTDYDIKNYLQKIYNLPVVDVKSRVFHGVIKPQPGGKFLGKEHDYRLASVHLQKDVTFDFPKEDLFIADGINDEVSRIKKAKREMKEMNQQAIEDRTHLKPGLPTWFS